MKKEIQIGGSSLRWRGRIKVTPPTEFDIGYSAGKQAANEYRCMLFGCHYGVEGVNKEPLDQCMFCEKPRYPKQTYYGKSIIDSLSADEAIAKQNKENRERNASLNRPPQRQITKEEL